MSKFTTIMLIIISLCLVATIYLWDSERDRRIELEAEVIELKYMFDTMKRSLIDCESTLYGIYFDKMLENSPFNGRVEVYYTTPDTLLEGTM